MLRSSHRTFSIRAETFGPAATLSGEENGTKLGMHPEQPSNAATSATAADRHRDSWPSDGVESRKLSWAFEPPHLRKTAKSTIPLLHRRCFSLRSCPVAKQNSLGSSNTIERVSTLSSSPGYDRDEGEIPACAISFPLVALSQLHRAIGVVVAIGGRLTRIVRMGGLPGQIRPAEIGRVSLVQNGECGNPARVARWQDREGRFSIRGSCLNG